MKYPHIPLICSQKMLRTVEIHSDTNRLLQINMYNLLIIRYLGNTKNLHKNNLFYNLHQLQEFIPAPTTDI
jgi:hypothetical protein